MVAHELGGALHVTARQQVMRWDYVAKRLGHRSRLAMPEGGGLGLE
jgi:hypothetical protein